MPKPGGTTARGYGRAHQVEKDKHRPTVDSGQALCTEPICLMPDRWIKPGTAWDLSHDRLNGGYLGPSHATCNRAEGGRWRHVKRQAQAATRWII